jgi:CRISPR/Cas system CSM-associated protein Csm4 (group 5 of RAMP superfamily)
MVEIKSPHNMHQWFIYLGDEDRETLEKELENSIPLINKLNAAKKVN